MKVGLLYTPLPQLHLPVLHGRKSYGALAATQARLLAISAVLASGQVGTGWWKHLWALVMPAGS